MIDRWLDQNRSLLIKVRHWLHQHPEIGFDEYKTSEYLQNILKSAGYSIIQTSDMKTGFTCEYGHNDEKILGVRCDMDGLLIQEVSDKPYCSVNDGVMHACGHDIHMTIVLGLALYLQDVKSDINGKIRFLFQPAEEQAPGGAIAMIEGGAIENMDHIVGGHVLPKLSADKIGLKHGAMAATVEMIEVDMKGPGGHTSRPAETVDLIWAMSHLVLSLEESIHHHIEPEEPVVLAFGKVDGGHTHNVLPESIILHGTLRYLNLNIKNRLHEIFEDTVRSVEKMTGAEITWTIPYTSPGLFNDNFMTNILVDASERSLGKEKVKILHESSMGGEDFAYYLKHIPGSYYRIGCNNGVSSDVHTSNFDVDEDCIFTALKVLTQAIPIYFSQ